MHVWVDTMTDELLEWRLKDLSFACLARLGAMSTTHATQFFCTNICEDSQSIQDVQDLLAQLWKQSAVFANGNLELDWFIDGVARLMDETERIDLLPGEDALRCSASYCIKAMEPNTPINEIVQFVKGTMMNGYEAVFGFQFHRGDWSFTEEEAYEAQCDSEPCKAEITFQIELLEYFEKNKGTTISYDELPEQFRKIEKFNLGPD